jgi:hypothetical protein
MSNGGKETRGGPPVWESSLALTPSHHIKLLITKCVKEHPTWTDSSDKPPKLRNMGTMFGTWNVKSLYRAGSLMAFTKTIKI